MITHKRPLNWEEFRKVMNIVDKQHKLTPTKERGIYTPHRKAIRAVMPIIDMRNNTVFVLTIFSGYLDGGKIEFTDVVKKDTKHDSMIDEIIEWLETPLEYEKFHENN